MLCTALQKPSFQNYFSQDGGFIFISRRDNAFGGRFTHMLGYLKSKARAEISSVSTSMLAEFTTQIACIKMQ